MTIFACRRSGSHTDIFFPKEEKTRRRSSVFSKISGYRQNKKVRLFCVLFLGQTELHFASFILFSVPLPVLRESLVVIVMISHLLFAYFMFFCVFVDVLLSKISSVFFKSIIFLVSFLCSLGKQVFRLWFPSHNNKFILKASV